MKRAAADGCEEGRGRGRMPCLRGKSGLLFDNYQAVSGGAVARILCS